MNPTAVVPSTGLSRKNKYRCSSHYNVLHFLCSGIEDDSASLMQQKLEKQVSSQHHTLYSLCCCLFVSLVLCHESRLTHA